MRKNRFGGGSQDDQDGGTTCLGGGTHRVFQQSLPIKPDELFWFSQPARRTRSQDNGRDIFNHALSAHCAWR